MFIYVGVLKNVVCFDNSLISFLRDRMKKKATLFDMTYKLFQYHSAVRGYHYNKKCWKTIEDQTLDCKHEKNKPFDFLATKVMEQDSRKTEGQLPMENCRATKFLLDRGARINTKLTSFK